MTKTKNGERSEPFQTLITTRASVPVETEAQCKKGGYLWLTHMDGRTVTIKVSCKTWDCRVCRDKNLGRVVGRMSYGLSVLGDCVLCTITYAVRGFKAQKLKRNWAAFLKMLRSEYPRVAWFRVPELTKRGILHYHVLMGNVETTWIRCKAAWTPTRLGDHCLMCKIRRWWYEVTTDSYICDVREVYNASGAAYYLSKYLKKQMFGDRTDMEELGMARRWSRSNNWPTWEGGLKESGNWRRIVRYAGKSEVAEKRVKADKDSELLEPNQDEVLKELRRRADVRKGRRKGAHILKKT